MGRKLPDIDESNGRNEPAAARKDKYIRNTLGHRVGLNTLHQRENAIRKGLYFGWDASPRSLRSSQVTRWKLSVSYRRLHGPLTWIEYSIALGQPADRGAPSFHSSLRRELLIWTRLGAPTCGVAST